LRIKKGLLGEQAKLVNLEYCSIGMIYTQMVYIWNSFKFCLRPSGFYATHKLTGFVSRIIILGLAYIASRFWQTA